MKDVFNEISKGGLTTFLNAMTGPDTTYYPFATRNEKEYFNIMDVYMDTIFHPKLEEFAFMQEGWRHHLENPNDQIEIKGVVYNEMKGALSNPTTQIWYTLFKHLMPNSTYSHISGGDPIHIPDLTWDYLKEFHNQFYHPSNSVIFLYGNAPLEKELEFLNKNYLSDFEKQKITEDINFGNQVESFKKIESSYAINANDKTDEKTFLAIGIPVSTADNEEENLALKILGEILFSSDASPFKLDFNNSGIGKDIEGGLIDNNYRTIMFAEVIGSEPKKMDEFIELFKSSMTEIIKNGLDKELILSELNGFEFQNREESCNSQRGLNYGMRIVKSTKLGEDPFEGLKFDKLFNSIRNKILNENYLEKLIKTKLLNFDQSVCVSLKPEPGKSDNESKVLNKKLADLKTSLSNDKISKLIQKTSDFEKYQNKENTEAEIATLPFINKNDIPEKLDLISPQIEIGGNNTSSIISEIFTGGISYISIGFDCSTIPQRLLPYLDIFGHILTEIGTKNLNYIEFAKKINIFTGSFNHQFSVFNKRKDRDSYRPIFWLKTKILREYITEGLEILEDVILNHDFSNRKRIKEILKRNFAWVENHVQSEGYHLPLYRTRSLLHSSNVYLEEVSGSTAYFKLKNIVHNYDTLESEVLSAIKEISELLFNQHNLVTSITAEEKDIVTIQPLLKNIIKNLSSKKHPKQEIQHQLKLKNDAFISSAEIVFAVQSGDIIDSGVNYNGAFEVLKSYLSNEFLHENIRAKGGAYGCFPILDSITGAFSFVSYRDPNVKSTFDIFNQIPNAIKNISMSNRSLEQLIIGTYSHFDPLLNPYMQGARAKNRFLVGSDDEYLYRILSEIKSTTVEQMRSFSESMEIFTKNSVKGIIGNSDKIQNNKELFDQLIEL
ncbi:MAG: insulinase family protein [Candidatus Marinimicrobia bacterium]|nr:insulinase family protein [Candidatus Neomarinimicrobiota bacterium]